MSRVAAALAALLIPAPALIPALPGAAAVPAAATAVPAAWTAVPAAATVALAEPSGTASPATGAAPDPRELTRTRFTVDGTALPAHPRPHVTGRRATPAPATPDPATPAPTTPGPATPAVGTSRDWLGLDDTTGHFYRKTYTLRAVGTHIEVWVARDLAFPAGDCRTGGPDVTDTQIAGLIHEFDTTIYPRETAAFSTPPDRDGTKATLDGDFTGAGDRTVTLVDNIRDGNYYDRAGATYVAGFFSPQLSELVDRNVMTIDSYDWAHRTGARPPSDPTGDPCTSRTARARLYEGTFAHEWQHLLHYYTDPDEAVWVNEGLSDYAETLVGYVDSTRGVYRFGFDVHLACFQGFGTVPTAYNNARRCGGPQNSLNLWDEGTATEVLADYGNAYQFMLYLRDRFGPAVLSRLHRDGQHQGLAAVAAALPAGTSLYATLHAYQTMTLTDRITGGIPSLKSAVNLSNPDAYDWPGAAPNGADYVRLRDAKGHCLRGRDLTGVTFAGASTLPPDPLRWTAAADGGLFSGNDSDTDAAAVTEVTVPAIDPVLRLSASYGFETGFDFGYVTVSDDGGRTYVPIAGDRTGAGPLGPALTGSSGGVVPLRYDLSPYAGRTVLLAFRYVSDTSVNLGGWTISGISVGATTVPSTPDRFRSPTRIRPVPVAAWSARLVGMTAHAVTEVPVRDWAALRSYDEVVAIVAYDEPTGTVTRYAPYSLTANGVVQPGGA